MEHLQPERDRFGFSAKGMLKHSDWDLAIYASAVGEEVSIQIETEFAPKR